MRYAVLLCAARDPKSPIFQINQFSSAPPTGQFEAENQQRGKMAAYLFGVSNYCRGLTLQLCQAWDLSLLARWSSICFHLLPGVETGAKTNVSDRPILSISIALSFGMGQRFMLLNALFWHDYEKTSLWCEYRGCPLS